MVRMMGLSVFTAKISFWDPLPQARFSQKINNKFGMVLAGICGGVTGEFIQTQSYLTPSKGL